MDKRKIIIFMDIIYHIGGGETWLYNLTSVIKDYFDIRVLYRTADPEQLARLPVKAVRYNPRCYYECDILLNLFTGRPYGVNAKRYIQVIHSNYSELPWYKYQDWGKTDGYIFVSERAKECFTADTTGKDVVVLKNPVSRPSIRKKNYKIGEKLKLMSATRLSEEKGWSKMVELCQYLEKNDIDFVYDIWTTWTAERIAKDTGAQPHKNMVFHESKLDLKQEMVAADYVVQLSDSEAFCYTIYEALALKVPVIVNNWGGVEAAVKHSKNGYILSPAHPFPTVEQMLNPPTDFVRIEDNARPWIHFLETLELKERQKMFNYFFK